MDPDVERRIREAYAAFAAGDMEGATTTFSDEVRLVNPDYAMEGGVREGLASLREGLRNLHDQFDYHSLEIQEMIEGEAGVLVIARLRASGRSSRVPIDEVFSHVFRIHDGRVVSYEWFRTREEGLAALATEPLGG